MNPPQSQIISGPAFGSSKKFQFIEMTPMEYLLKVINNVRQVPTSDQSPSTHQTMSIESILDSNGGPHRQRHHSLPTDHSSSSSSISSMTVLPPATKDDTAVLESSRKRYLDRGESEPQSKKICLPPSQHTFPSCSASTLPASPPMTRRTNTISCLHAVVAQKSYGSEKRFLCPPPIVSIKGDFHDQPLVSMSVICDGANEKPTEQHTLLDEHMQGSFKYLHASGVTKSKQFYLKVDLRPNVHNNSNNNATNASHPSSPSPGTKPYATFLSMPISLISKPSKKTAKARNISTCFLANSMVALYNRINSQTVRTKYMTSEKGRLCGKASSWSAFKILVLQQPQNHNHGRMIRSYAPPSQTPAHITYGTEIILEDVNTGVTSPPLILRKVEKGHIASCSFAPMNQMQKVALQLSSSVGKEPMYLSCDRVSPSCQGDVVDDANNNYAHSATIWLDFFRSRCLADGKEAVDDFLCWTIVGVSRFEYTYAEPDVVEASSWSPSCPAPPSLSPSSSSSSTWQPLSQPSPPPSPPRSLMPFPFLTSVQYISSSHSLRIQGQHLMQSISSSTSRLLEFWLGAHGPLKVTEPENDPHQDLFVELPNTHDLLVANHNLLTTQPDGSRYLELPLLLVRHDGIAYHSGKALACDIVDDAGRWHVVAATMSS